jgi:hypothetical protein
LSGLLDQPMTTDKAIERLSKDDGEDKPLPAISCLVGICGLLSL